MERISLLDIIGPSCSTATDGQKIRLLIESFLKEGKSIELDFSCVKLVTPSFYQAAVSDLYCGFSDEVIRSRLRFSAYPASSEETSKFPRS